MAGFLGYGESLTGHTASATHRVPEASPSNEHLTGCRGEERLWIMDVQVGIHPSSTDCIFDDVVLAQGQSDCNFCRMIKDSLIARSLLTIVRFEGDERVHLGHKKISGSHRIFNLR